MWEQDQIQKASMGHEEKLNLANNAAREAASILQDKESGLDKQTEDAARLSARHQSAHRLLDEAKALLEKRQTDSDSAVSNVLIAEQGLEEAQERLKQATATRAITQEVMLKSLLHFHL